MTTFYEGDSSFENASVMLEVCLEVFKSQDLAEEAKKVRGLEATSFNTAYASLLTLQEIKTDNSEVENALQDAIRALQECVVAPRLAS